MPRVLPSWVKESNTENEEQIKKNLTNAAKASKQKRENRKEREQHNNDSNINHRSPPKPSSLPPIIDNLPEAQSPHIKTQNQHKHNYNKSPAKTKTKKTNKSPTKQKKKSPAKKPKRKKKRKNKNNLVLGTDEDEWSDTDIESAGSLVDFVINDVASDEEYDPANDISIHNHNRDLISDDEDDMNESFGSLMNLNENSYNSMIISSPPKKKRKGIRVVCNIKPLCQWGEKCYRRNMRHLEEYAHPWKDREK